MNLPYEYKTKSQAIYTAIRGMITSGDYEPEEIFNSVDIARRFGVSRTPVTEAVKMLEARGLVTILPGVGFKVRKPTMLEVLELLEIRGALELLAIKKAVKLCCTDDVNCLDNILFEIEKCLKTRDVEEYLRLNEEFHFKLYKLSKYSRLIQLQRDLWDCEGWYASVLHDNPQEIKILLADHHKIVNCLRDKDSAQSEVVAQEHWFHCVEVLQKKIKQSFEKEDNNEV